MNPSSATADIQQICTWLGLPANCWPPDHYLLLGLPPCEASVELIEHKVHERLMRVRSYQLSHPALATEAMMHLAKAYDCLTNPVRKRAYDTLTFPHLATAQAPVHSARHPTVLDTDTAETAPVSSIPPVVREVKEGSRPPLQWQSITAAPPVRPARDPAEPPGRVPAANDPAEPPPVRLQVPVAEPAASGDFPVAQPAPGPVQPPMETTGDATSARPATFATVGLERLATRRDYFECLCWTRRLVRAWNRAGKYLNKPGRKLVKAAEGNELTRLLFAIDNVLHEAPGLLGQPGQPGYRILALCSQEPVADHFKTLDERQRAALAQDWTAGSAHLAEFRKQLMEQVKSQRRLTRWQRGRRAVDGLLALYGGYVILVFILLAALVLLAASLW
jgi:hypothetical protein